MRTVYCELHVPSSDRVRLSQPEDAAGVSVPESRMLSDGGDVRTIAGEVER